jgi:acetate kinase
MTGSILTLNAGSSSLKFALFNAVGEMQATVRGELEQKGDDAHFVARDASGHVLADKSWPLDGGASLPNGLGRVLDFMEAHLGDTALIAVGHRVVHGGSHHTAPEAVTPALIAALEALTPLDPLHMPANLAPMRSVAAARPSLKQVACFDTAFHHDMPSVASRFALPRALEAEGVRRYGFHGLSYEYIAGRLAKQSPVLAKGRVIAAHLGSGASLCAMHDGRSIDTTTGFSALDGLMMATRCGILDPGVILYLGRQGHSFADIEDMLYRRSGLLGVSGLSADIRVLLASDNPHAAEAIELFTYRIAAQTGAMVSALGGLDGLVFTAGIGEHAPAIRAAICGRLAWLGIQIDADANESNAARISTPNSKIDVRVIATDEEAMIAQHTRTVINQHTL